MPATVWDHLRLAGVTAALVLIIMAACDPAQRWIVAVALVGPWAYVHTALAKGSR